MSTTPAEPSEPVAPAADEVSVHIDRSPEQVWDMVSDVTRMGEWSPECFRCRWVGSPKGPEVGARFVGFNRAGWRIWATPNVVVEADRGRIFAWRTVINGTIWSYRMEAAEDGHGALVTESRQLPAKRPWYAKLLLDVFFGGTVKHDARMRQGVRQTVDRLKAAAEGG
jgi:uncharacterized protein YndB with AHSA1/START domain